MPDFCNCYVYVYDIARPNSESSVLFMSCSLGYYSVNIGLQSSFDVQIAKRIPDLCSVLLTAELVALLLAINLIRDVKPSRSNSAIFKAAIQNPVEHIKNNAIIKEIDVTLYKLLHNQIKSILNRKPRY